MIREDLLHYVWKTKKFDLRNLRSESGESIEILNFGIHNKDSGPDFFNARLKISETLWIGNIEMHVFASDWKKHKHETDPAYENVILHVVFENDEVIKRRDDSRIPCLVLKERIPSGLSNTYLKLLHTESWIPCQKLIHRVDPLTKVMWLETLAIERIQNKTHYIKTILDKKKGDWEETLYLLLCKNFGSRVNSMAFEKLADSLSFKILHKHRDNIFQIEALLFGQAGFLDYSPKDEYPLLLKKEYMFLSKKYQLDSIPKILWKFMRMRPANFPTVRIAQLAGIIHKRPFLFSSIVEAGNINHLNNIFVSVTTSYWDNHYTFRKQSPYREKKIGKSMIDLIIINTVSPFLFLYGQETGNEKLKSLALNYLEEISPEKNKIIKGWSKIGITAKSAHQTQALIQLKQEYCNKKRCLECSLGHSILKS